MSKVFIKLLVKILRFLQKLSPKTLFQNKEKFLASLKQPLGPHRAPKIPACLSRSRNRNAKPVPKFPAGFSSRPAQIISDESDEDFEKVEEIREADLDEITRMRRRRAAEKGIVLTTNTESYSNIRTHRQGARESRYRPWF
jgi:hypothetical protein